MKETEKPEEAQLAEDEVEDVKSDDEQEPPAQEETINVEEEEMDDEMLRIAEERQAMYDDQKYEIRNNAWRYPIGFRHFESYNHYQMKYPDATIEEY